MLSSVFTSHQSFTSNIVSLVKPLQITLELGLWSTTDDVEHWLLFATPSLVSHCKVPRAFVWQDVQQSWLVQKWFTCDFVADWFFWLQHHSLQIQKLFYTICALELSVTVTLLPLYFCLFLLYECFYATNPASWLPQSNKCYVKNVIFNPVCNHPAPDWWCLCAEGEACMMEDSCLEARHTNTHTTILRPFSGTSSVRRCQKRTSGHSAREN